MLKLNSHNSASLEIKSLVFLLLGACESSLSSRTRNRHFAFKITLSLLCNKLFGKFIRKVEPKCKCGEEAEKMFEDGASVCDACLDHAN